MITTLLIVLFNIFAISSSNENRNIPDRTHNIACHTTDFQCFKLQYEVLRDTAQPTLTPYAFTYGDTCVKLSGVELSQLVAMSMNSSTMEYEMVIEFPLIIEQIMNTTVECNPPDTEFGNIEHQGTLRKFPGNATVTVTYPYTLHKRKGNMYMVMKDENVEVLLDIPDLSQHNKKSQFETLLYAWSEWAYEMVQHVDVAHHCVLPYTEQLGKVMSRVPLEKRLWLYPDEEYADLQFSYKDPNVASADD